MNWVKNEFPNPVLAKGRDDYVETCTFYSQLELEDIKVDDKNIVFPISYVLESDGIKSLISQGQAQAIVLARSPNTKYRRIFPFAPDQTSQTIKIDKYAVAKKIELQCSVVASEAISRFCCEGEFNPVYFFASETFEIRKGDILASEDLRVINLDDSELEKPLMSIFRINLCDEQDYEIETFFGDDYIQINLRQSLKQMYDTYKDAEGGELRRFINAVVVFPALVQAMNYILAYYNTEEGEVVDFGIDQIEEKMWFRSIVRQAEKKDINLVHQDYAYAVPLANLLCGNITLDALGSFKAVWDREFNSGDIVQIGGQD